MLAPLGAILAAALALALSAPADAGSVPGAAGAAPSAPSGRPRPADSQAGAGCGLPPLRSGSLPFRAGETLRFDIDVMGVVKAGTVSLTVDRPTFRGRQIPLQARLRNTSVFAKVRRVTGVALSWVDARTLRPERYVDETLEDGVKKTSDTRIPPGASEITIASQFGDRQEKITSARQGEVLDALSFLYFLRAAALRPGQGVCLDVVANRRYWRLAAKVAPGSDRVDSEAGTFDTLRIDGVATRADQPRTKRPLHLWISTDSRHLPVALVSEVDLGPVKMMLARISGR